MLNISQLLNPDFQRGSHNQNTDLLRYQKDKGEFKPVIVWNITYRCNLECIHCYAASNSKVVPGELTLAECLNIVNELAKNGITYLILSGGDPLISPHIFPIVEAASKANIPLSLSTNGTLIKKETAGYLKSMGVTYVGISLDGIGDANDKVRGQKGAFDRALRGARFCKDEGIKVGLRMTLMQDTLPYVESMVNLAREESFDRLYFSHLVSSGRGEEMDEKALNLIQTREVVDRLIKASQINIERKIPLEIVTGSNDTDGVYLYLKQKSENAPEAATIYKRLLMKGGNTSGEKILNIDNIGNVYPDQFWRNYPLGNLKTTAFEEIWNRNNSTLLSNLYRREELLEGRCAQCSHIKLCRGNTRARAEFSTGRKWASDPACYLTDQEIEIQ